MSSARGVEPAHTGHGPADDLNLPALLAIHALVWTFAAWASRANLDLAGDMVESYVWGIEWQAGYVKHPPLFAWIAGAWFSVMPRADWAYSALSASNAALGLLGVAALARRFLPAQPAAIAALTLAVSPLYTTLAIKFNANAVLLSFWPWAAFHFVAYLQSGRRRHAAVCGALVALALLGKYFSVVLLLTFVVAGLAVPAWRSRMRGTGPWIALLAGAVVLLPHAAWLVDHQFITLRYASDRSAGDLVSGLLRLANYSAAQFAYLLPSAFLLICAVRVGQRRQALSLLMLPTVQPAMRLELWWLALGPMLVIAAIAVLAQTPMASVWGMAQWFAITALWLSALSHHGVMVRASSLRRVMILYWLAVVLLAPALGIANAHRGISAAVEPRAELAQVAQAQWHVRTGRELAIVGGVGVEAMSLAFYANGKPRWWNPAAPQTTPWITLADWQREGGVIVCMEADIDCQRVAQTLVATDPVFVSIEKRAWTTNLTPRHYRLYFGETSSADSSPTSSPAP
ncbi:MAG: glycosyltransferase family 39 protein [Burkholderiaceae bacterium]